MTDKKIVLVINAHSFIDVITNSSTELFVCDTDKSVAMVTEIIKEKMEHFNKLHDTNHSFDDCFDDPYIYTQAQADRSKASKYGGWGYEKDSNVGKIIISGASSNTIPYEMFDLIEDLFNASRYHLG